MKNIVLIGMPAVGKSTIGVLLAKSLGFSFVDTDLIIQRNTGRLLQDIIDKDGLGEFCRCEENAVLDVAETENAVIATGGSAVYSEKGMRFLKENGVVIYLALPVEELENRLSDITTRGIAKAPDETLEDLFAHRAALYEKYADTVINCAGKSPEQTVREIISAVAQKLKRFRKCL